MKIAVENPECVGLRYVDLRSGNKGLSHLEIHTDIKYPEVNTMSSQGGEERSRAGVCMSTDAIEGGLTHVWLVPDSDEEEEFISKCDFALVENRYGPSYYLVGGSIRVSIVDCVIEKWEKK